jgi:hypothetical protein
MVSNLFPLYRKMFGKKPGVTRVHLDTRILANETKLCITMMNTNTTNLHSERRTGLHLAF